MFATAHWFDAWMSRTALAGGVLLLLGLLGMLFFRQPARRQRWGELAVLSSLLVAILAALPAWWGLAAATTPSAPKPATVEPAPPAPLDFVEEPTEAPIIVGLLDADEMEWLAEEGEQPLAAPESLASAAAETRRIPWLTIVAVVYATLMLVLLLRCLVGYFALWRMCKNAHAAPARVRKLLAELTPAGQPVPLLAVTDRLRTPVSFGLRRPTILLPAGFCQPGQDLAVASVLVHELTHLQRRDAWSCLLLAISQSVYFYQPWFWWLKKQVRLAQEFIADAAAARVLPAVDYAQYLVHLSSQANPGSLAASRANGVFQSPSDLARRIEMLLNPSSRLERFAPRGWSLLAAGLFIGAGTLMSGVRLHAEDEPAPPKADALRTAKVITVDAEECKECQDQLVEADVALSFAFSEDEGEKGPRRVWVVASPEAEHLAKLEKALEALKAAAKKLGDDVPEEVRQQLRDVEKQLAEARARTRTLPARVAVGGRMAEAQSTAANAEMARRLAEAQRRAAAQKERIDAELRRLRAEAESLAAQTKRRLNQLANSDMDETKRLQELETLRALMSKSKELKSRIAQTEKQAQVEAANLKIAETERETAKPKESEMVRIPRAPAPPTPPAPPLAGLPGQRSFMPLRGGFPGQQNFLLQPQVISRLGVRLEPVPAVLAHQMKLEEGQGLVIMEVRPESRAADKLRKFDVLLELDGNRVKADAVSFARELGEIKAEEPIRLRVLRGGKVILLEDVKLPSDKDAPEARWIEVPPGTQPGEVQFRLHRDSFVPRQQHDKVRTQPQVERWKLETHPPKTSMPKIEVEVDQLNQAQVESLKKLKELKLDTKAIEKFSQGKVEAEIRGRMDGLADKIELMVTPGVLKNLEEAKVNISKVAPSSGKSDSSRRNVSLMISRNDKELRIRQQEDQETIVVRAKIEGGKTIIERIEIDDGSKKVKIFKSMDEVDAPFRAKIRKLLEAADQGDSRAGDGSI